MISQSTIDEMKALAEYDEYVRMQKKMETFVVDQFKEWAQTHNTENYGRFDAFKAGYELAKKEATT